MTARLRAPALVVVAALAIPSATGTSLKQPRGGSSARQVAAGSGLLYSTYLGGSGDDSANAIAVDGAGSVYVTGSTSSENFPTIGGLERSRSGDDAFVTKLNPSGSVAYSIRFGGSGSDRGTDIAVDGAGSAYVVGLTRSKNFPTTAGVFDRSYNSAGRENEGDAFVVKLDPAGSALVYSTYLGGSGDERSGVTGGTGIAVGGAGGTYVTGSTTSKNFPTTAGALDRRLGGTSDLFVTKLNAAGSTLAYSTYLGGSDEEGEASIAIDRAGNAYLAGTTPSADFPTTAGAFERSLSGFNRDAFVTKLNPAGSALAYSTYLGGSETDEAYAIAVGGGNAYVTGSTDSNDFPTTADAFDTSFNRNVGDVFVTKLNTAGSALVYSTYLGGNSIADLGRDEALNESEGIAVDGVGNAYVTGLTDALDFPTTAGAFQESSGGGAYVSDGFVTELNPAGSALVYSTFVGGRGDDAAGGIAVDRAGSGYVTGSTASRAFPTTTSAFDRIYNGSGQVLDQGVGDAFVAKLDLGDWLYVEPSHGFTQEIQDEFGGHTDLEYWRAHLAAWKRFGPDYLRGVGKYVTSSGDLRLSRPGTSRWAPGVRRFLRDWFSQSGLIAFQSNRDGNAEIYVLDAGGSGQRNLSRSRGNDEHPAWSADGRWIAFDSDRDHNNEIYVMAADGSGQRNLTRDRADDRIPAWSPDGRQIAFMSNRDATGSIYAFNIYVMAADGSRVRRLTRNPPGDTYSSERSPAWSPDGMRIAFERARKIYVMNADGRGLRRLTGTASEEVGAKRPRWSPDGRRIFFQRGGEMYVMAANGRGQRPVTRTSYFNCEGDGFAWSPDRRRIACVRWRSREYHVVGNWEIYAMAVDGSGLRNLTHNRARDQNPSWSVGG